MKGKQEIEIPKGGKVLTVQMQRDIPCLWILIDQESELEKRRFEVHGTGWIIEKAKNFNI